MYYTQEQIDRANQADLVSFLQSQGEQLTRAGQEYRWKRHDSLTIRGNKWYRHSQSKGGAPIDFVMEFFGKSFTEAVELLTGEKGAAPPPDRPSPAPLSDFPLPPRSVRSTRADAARQPHGHGRHTMGAHGLPSPKNERAPPIWVLPRGCDRAGRGRPGIFLQKNP